MKDHTKNSRLGIATPQANPTVEAEMRRIIPNNIDYCVLRLLSKSSDPKTRLIDYLVNLPENIKTQFSDLSINTLLFGCTASTYLLGEEIEKEILANASEALGGARIVTAAGAIKKLLIAEKITRVGMLTPYPEWLQVYAEEYWSRSGVEVVAVQRVDIGSEDTYKIYDLEAEDAMPGFLRLLSKDCGAVLISGTGMPSLKLINNNETNGKKVISSNYAMARIGLSYLGIESRTKSEWF